MLGRSQPHSASCRQIWKNDERATMGVLLVHREGRSRHLCVRRKKWQRSDSKSKKEMIMTAVVDVNLKMIKVNLLRMEFK